MSRFARSFVCASVPPPRDGTAYGYCEFVALCLYRGTDVTVTAGCYRLFCVTELFLSVSAVSFIPDVRRLPSNLISDIRRVLSMLRRAITICPTMSNTGFKTMLGLPPAIPTRTIKTKRRRNICSIPQSTELASVIVSPPVTGELWNPTHEAPMSSANSPGDCYRFYMFGLTDSKTGRHRPWCYGFHAMATPAQEPVNSNVSRPCFQSAVPGGIVTVLGSFASYANAVL